jgi:hypothetical protein
MSLIDRNHPGSRVTIRVPKGLRIDRQTGKLVREWKEATGRAVMRSSVGGWVLKMGGRYGTPGLADEKNVVAVAPSRQRGR